MDLTPEEKEKIHLEEIERHKAQAKIKGKETAQGCLGCLVLFIIIAIFIASCGKKDKPEILPNNEVSAWIVAKYEISKYTTGPNSTIVFPDEYTTNKTVFKIGENEYSVNSHVTYQDREGKNVLATFSCKSVYSDTGWEVNDIHFTK